MKPTRTVLLQPPDDDGGSSPRSEPTADLLAGLARFPRLELGHQPTPVFAATDPDGRRFWIKDDGTFSSLYGGNKPRKLEFLLAEARRSGAKTLIVHGDIGSHTVLACGLHGRSVGFDVHAVVFPHRGQSADAPELSSLQGAGVHIHRCRTMLTALAQANWLGWRLHGCVVPLGASTPLATLGHVQAVLELRAQIDAGLLPEPERIYMPFATGGTVAGILVGLALCGSGTKVVAVRTVESLIANRRRLERLVQCTLSLLGRAEDDFAGSMARLDLIDDAQLGRGFRDTTAAAEHAVTVAAGLGLALEPAYSGKAFASLLKTLSGHYSGPLLFWNTHARQSLDSCTGTSEAAPLQHCRP